MSARAWLPGLVIAAATVAFASVIAPHGLGVTPDSGAYLALADALVDGRGFRLHGPGAEGHWAPGYPLLIAGVQWTTGLDAFAAAGVLHVGLFFALGWALAKLYGQLSDDAVLVALATLASLAAVPTTLARSALSELAFLVAVTLLAFVLMRYRRRPTGGLLAGVSAVLGLLVGLRYAGLFLCPGAALVVWSSHRSWRKGLGAASLLAVGPAAVVLAWGAYLTANGYASMRSIGWHPISAADAFDFALVPALWWVERDFLALHGVLYAGEAMLLLVGWRHLGEAWRLVRERLSHSHVAAVSLPLAASYLVLLATSISIADAYTPIDDRTLSPLLPLLMPFVLVGLDALRAASPTALRWSAYGISAVVAVTLALAALPLWRSHYQYGQGYSGTAYAKTVDALRAQRSRTVGTASDSLERRSAGSGGSEGPCAGAVLHESAPCVPLYTNAADLYAFANGDYPAWVPRRENSTSREPNPAMGEQCRRLSARVAAGEARVLLVDRPGWRPLFATADELRGGGIRERRVAPDLLYLERAGGHLGEETTPARPSH